MSGFDGRIYLTDEEHATYLRRAPVRYVTLPKTEICSVCGNPPTKDNPLQCSHKIPFLVGVRKYKLTPDFLDRPENLAWAHRKGCNKKVEWNDEEIQGYLRMHFYAFVPMK